MPKSTSYDYPYRPGRKPTGKGYSTNPLIRKKQYEKNKPTATLAIGAGAAVCQPQNAPKKEKD